MAPEEDQMIITTIYEVANLREDDDIKLVKGAVYDTPNVGAVAFVVTQERTLMFLKHPEGTTLDRGAIEKALASVGSFRLV